MQKGAKKSGKVVSLFTVDDRFYKAQCTALSRGELSTHHVKNNANSKRVERVVGLRH